MWRKMSREKFSGMIKKALDYNHRVGQYPFYEIGLLFKEIRNHPDRIGGSVRRIYCFRIQICTL